MRSVILMISTVMLTVSAQAAPMKCSAFAKAFSALKPDAAEANRAANTPLENVMVGFVMGVYYGATGQSFLEDEKPELRVYEQQVFDLCKADGSLALAEAAIAASKEVTKPKPLAENLSANSNIDGISLKTSKLASPIAGMTRVVLSLRNGTAESVNASVRCSLYDKAGEPLGQAGGWINNVSPGESAIGEAIGDASGAAKAECRVIRTNKPR